jgi:Holliday junction resolvase RusA-like endonuclease
LITITFDLPPSSNSAYPSNQHGGGRHLSKDGKVWKTTAKWQVEQTFRERDAPPRFALIIRLWFPDFRRRDVDSFIKLIKDALCEALFIDDNWRVIPRLHVEAMGVDKLNPRCEVTIMPLDATGTTERGGNGKSSVLV